MQLNLQTITLVSLMLLSGIGIPTMATINANLGGRLASPALASTILFGVAFFCCLAVTVISNDLNKNSSPFSAPLWTYTGGSLVAFYVLCVTWIAPKLGVGNAIAFVLLGQLIAITVIDHFGLMGALRYQLNPYRIIGLVLMAAGVFLVVRKY